MPSSLLNGSRCGCVSCEGRYDYRAYSRLGTGGRCFLYRHTILQYRPRNVRGGRDLAERARGSSGLAIARLAGASPPYVRWDGWQFGVDAGYGNMSTDFGNSTSPLVAFILRNSTLEAECAPSTWTTLPASTTNGPVFGGFIGYNMQWDQLVLGWDLAYKHPSILRSLRAIRLRARSSRRTQFNA